MSETTLSYIDAGITDDVPSWDGTTSYVNPGEYILEVTEIKGDQSNSGGQKMVLTYAVVEAIGEKAEENKDQVGRKVVQSQSLQAEKDGVKGRLASLVRALLGGFDARGGFDPNAMIGCQMACEIIEDTYTKMDPVTQEKMLRKTIKVIRERHLDELDAQVKEEAKAETKAAEPPPAGTATRQTTTRGRRTGNSRPSV